MARGLPRTHYKGNESVLKTVQRDESEWRGKFSEATFAELVDRGTLNENEALEVLETYVHEICRQKRWECGEQCFK